MELVVENVLVALCLVAGTAGMVDRAVRPLPAMAGASWFLAVWMPVWAVAVTLGGPVDLGLGADELARGHAGGWEGVVVGALAVACCPVVIWAYRVFSRRRRGGPPGKRAGEEAR